MKTLFSVSGHLSKRPVFSCLAVFVCERNIFIVIFLETHLGVRSEKLVDLTYRKPTIAEAFKAAIYNDIYTAFKGISATTVGLSNAYIGTGTADAEKILAIVEHTEAANGESAVIVGTKAALRKCPGAELGDNAKTDLYNAGYTKAAAMSGGSLAYMSVCGSSL